MPGGPAALAGLRRFLNRPYYVYRPSQLLRRAKLATEPGARGSEFRLPWGLSLRVDPAEGLGGAVARNAVYEIAVSEVLHRLCEPGDLALDIGANVGYMTSILAFRVGPGGQVIACEPHPDLYARLIENVERWRSEAPDLPPVTTLRVALSDRTGRGRLAVPPEFEVNMGLASLADDGGDQGLEVPVGRLEDVVPPDSAIGVAKLDVEGHEARVLAGGRRLLDRHGIRDLVLEEHHGYPSEATALLEAAGYRLFGLEQHLRGIRLTAPGEARPPDDGAPPNMVASCRPDRLIDRLSASGWRVLRARR